MDILTRDKKFINANLISASDVYVIVERNKSLHKIMTKDILKPIELSNIHKGIVIIDNDAIKFISCRDNYDLIKIGDIEYRRVREKIYEVV